MTREEAIKQLSELVDSEDVEAAHSAADDVLCKLLLSMGCDDVVSVWKAVEKWYA